MKILLPLIEWDIDCSHGQLLRLPGRLREGGLDVELVTTSKEVEKRLQEVYPDLPVQIPKPVTFPVTWPFRDELAKPFVHRTGDITIPGTELPFWKATAFDDFRGHISSTTYRSIDPDCDMILAPLPSMEDPMPDRDGVFFTHLFSRAKTKGIPIVFFQFYPVFSTPLLFMKFGDHYIVRDRFEADFYRWRGVPNEKLHRMDHPVDCYLLGLIADPYMDGFLEEKEFQITDRGINVTVVNHAKYRPQIREILRMLSRSNRKTTVFFVKRAYTVRSLTEDQILGEILDDEFDRKGKAALVMVEGHRMYRAVMASDAVISPFYLNALAFARRYDKEALIHNPRYGGYPMNDGVSVTSSVKELAMRIQGIRRDCPVYSDLGGILKEIFHGGS